MILEIAKAIMGLLIVVGMFVGYIWLLFYGIPLTYKWWNLMGAILFGRKEMLDKLHEGDLCGSKETRTIADRFEDVMGQPPNQMYNQGQQGWRGSGPFNWPKYVPFDERPPEKKHYDFPDEWNDLL